MRWRIEGADEKTGKEITVSVDAVDQARAEADARYRGIMISSISLEVSKTLEVIDYKSPGSSAGKGNSQRGKGSGAHYLRAARYFGEGLGSLAIGIINLAVVALYLAAGGMVINGCQTLNGAAAFQGLRTTTR